MLGKTRTLDSHASRLRRKLDPEHGRYVINCWGVPHRCGVRRERAPKKSAAYSDSPAASRASAGLE